MTLSIYGASSCIGRSQRYLGQCKIKPVFELWKAWVAFSQNHPSHRTLPDCKIQFDLPWHVHFKHEVKTNQSSIFQVVDGNLTFVTKLYRGEGGLSEPAGGFTHVSDRGAPDSTVLCQLTQFFPHYAQPKTRDQNRFIRKRCMISSL